jgi:ribonuclease T2
VRSAAILAAVLAALIIGTNLPRAADRAGDFDFYLLSLSWSPSWCEQAGERANPAQCRHNPPFGFVVHGLWPQYERGYPENCPTEFPLRLPRSVIDTILDIQPGVGLVGRQWRKHGTCSGLSPMDYLALTRAAFDRVDIPDKFENARRDRTAPASAIESAFVSANPDLTTKRIAVSCKSGDLVEVRICFTPDLEFRNCPDVDKAGCRANNLFVPAAP